MSHPFTHPRGRELLKRVARSFTSDDTYILRDSNIVFVCGGPMDEEKMRPRFCNYARDELPHLRVFLAELAQKDYVSHEEPEFHNIGEFEEIIAEVSDCVILFPESPGSFAELGYFARNEKLRKKLLVVNDAGLQGQDSFIALGPINTIDRYSRFQPTIQIEYDNNPAFNLVKDRLQHRITGKRRRKFKHKKYADIETREKFFSVLEILNIFQALTFEGIEYAFRSIFGNVNLTELRRLLSILVAAELIQRRGDEHEYFCINRNARSFIEFENLNIGTLRLEIVDFFEKEFPEMADVVKGLSE